MKQHLRAPMLASLCLVLSLLGPATADPAAAQNGPCPDTHDSLETACTLGDAGVVQEALPGAGGRNAYRFDVSSPGARVQLDLTDLPADYDLYLVDGAGNIVDQSVHEGATAESLDRTLDSAGTFFVYVLADPGRAVTSTPYSLHFALTGPPRWVLVRSDDFTHPAHGLFADSQRGTNRATFPDGPREYLWDYRYDGDALLAHILGPYPANSAVLEGASAVAADRVLADFAVEVRARVTKSPADGTFGVGYIVQPADYYAVGVGLGGTHYIWESRTGRDLAFGRSSALRPLQEGNTLRVELLGDTLRLFINGQLADVAQDPGLARRPGTLRLEWQARRPLADRDVEVRFEDFRVYVLE